MGASATSSSDVLDLIELGRRLQNARLALPLTLDEVAQRLHLPSATVADLEAGRSGRIGTPVYLKGFLRSYLKLTGLPEEWAEQALISLSSPEMPQILPAAGAVARRVPWIERYKWAASYVVGTALALTAVHWLVSNTPQLGFPDSSRATTVALEMPQTPPAAVTPAPASASPVAVAPLPGPLVPVTDENADELPVMASLNPFRVADDRPGAPAEVAALTLTFDQASWVDVRDGSGAKLTFQTVPAGEKRTFSVGAPFSVLIGNARGVRAEIAGEPVELEVFVRGNIARFAVAEGAQGWTTVSNDKDTTGRDDG